MSEKKINIRSANNEDVTALSEMIIRCVQHFHTHNYTAEQIEIWCRGYSVVEMNKQLQSRQVFVMENKGELYGTIQLDYPEIKGVYINPKYKGIGLGSKLLEFIFSLLKLNGYHQIELTSNPATVDYYKQFGFKLIEKEIVVWENEPFTEYRMRKTIS